MKKLITFSLFLVSFLISGTNLTNIVIKNCEQGTEVNLQLNGKTSYTDFVMGNRIVVDLLAVTPAFSENIFPNINRGGIKEIKISKIPSANLLRFVITADTAYTYQISQEDGKVALILNTGAGEFPEWKATDLNIEKAAKPPVEEKKSIQQYKNTNISLNLEEADIPTILRAIATYSGRNIIISDDVKGKITVKLTNVPWKRALQLILQSKGYAYVIEKDVIRVGTGNTFKEEREARELAQPLEQRVYEMEFTKPKDIRGTIKKLLSKRGHIEIDNRTNSIIVTDITDKLDKVTQLVRVLDKPTPQVEIQVRVVDVDRTATHNLGIDWSVKNVASRGLNLGSSADSLRVPGVPVGGAITLNLSTLRSFAQISSTLEALEQQQRLKTLANPRITTTNNKKATIFGGKSFAVTTTDPRTGSPVVQYYDAGINLVVTPHINSANEVTMQLTAVMSEITAAGANPTINKTQATTEALVKDGECLVIGGFIHKRETRIEGGVPILKNIPLIGAIFKHTSVEKSEREVLIFLTPHIIKNY